jgi:hypothetical protein
MGTIPRERAPSCRNVHLHSCNSPAPAGSEWLIPVILQIYGAVTYRHAYRVALPRDAAIVRPLRPFARLTTMPVHPFSSSSSSSSSSASRAPERKAAPCCSHPRHLQLVPVSLPISDTAILTLTDRRDGVHDSGVLAGSHIPRAPRPGRRSRRQRLVPSEPTRLRLPGSGSDPAPLAAATSRLSQSSSPAI